MASSVEIECKKIIVRRCLYAISCSIALQYFLLLVYLLLINFSLLHPINWVTTSFSMILSISTWIYTIPLISLVILNGLLISKGYLSEMRYYPNRLSRIYHNFARNLSFLAVFTLIGFSTAWLYLKFMGDDYRFMYECSNGRYCIDQSYLMVVLLGIMNGMLYYWRRQNTSVINFPIIQQNLYGEIRSEVYGTLFGSLRVKALPIFLAVYYILSLAFGNAIEQLFNTIIESNRFSIFNPKFIFYSWLLSWQIQSNLKLLDKLLVIFLTEPSMFPIESEVKAMGNDFSTNVTLIDGLSCMNIPIIMQLACLDLLSLANLKNSFRRQQIFALSVPGGHPYTWNALSSQCLSLLSAFNAELDNAKSTISKCSIPIQPIKMETRFLRPTTATELADQIRFRQFNESMGIRNMSRLETIHDVENIPSDPLNFFYEFGKIITDQYRRIITSIFNIPIINYLFVETSIGKMSFLLDKSEHIMWLAQGLATVASHSLAEDKYGVVQSQLSSIILQLLQLKRSLDEINLDDYELRRKCSAVKSAIKRSLYIICYAFSDYLSDIILDTNQLRIATNYANFREV